jgi:hypothetical protein
MTRVKVLLVAPIAAAAFTTQAMAARRDVPLPRAAADAYASVVRTGRYVDRSFCAPAPRVGAFATAPWTNDTPCEPGTGY